jgi:hypothetical protein
MQAKAITKWAGMLSIVWMLSGFVFIHYVIVPRQIVVGPFWRWTFVLLSVQLVPALFLAIVGLRCGSRAGRVYGILAIGLLLWFVWYGVVPAAAVLLQLG